MMSLGTIQRMSDQAARRAASQRRVPYVPYNEDEIDRMPPIPFPILGGHVPDGWTEVGDPIFVDSSGLGEDNEPALSVRRFLDTVRANMPHGYGYGVVEAGQFQVYVQAYAPPAGYKARRHPAR